MRQLTHPFYLVKYFSTNKVYYPALLSPNYDNIDFNPFYVLSFLLQLASNRNKASSDQ